MLFGQKHVERYQATNGAEGHEWQPGVLTLLLTTTGRKSGEDRTTPLIYGEHGDDPVIVASNGGGDPPAWFLNIEEDPTVDVQIEGDKFHATARVATDDEKAEL
ncbi:MAG: nitroreductase family deazaflavin-dependent oxidoreductase, partial [Solirubrobacteraceae bacterium]|nr:nitroreductase family deazaflavin-dependent oxidoreductase [Solirubrobacteraceae bacterium]